MLVVGLTGASLLAVGLLQKKGFSINEDMIKIILTCTSYGAILYLFKIISQLFLYL